MASAPTTIISLSQMAHKHSRRVQRESRRDGYGRTARVNQPNRSMIYKKKEVTSRENESSCSLQDCERNINSRRNLLASAAVPSFNKTVTIENFVSPVY